MREVACGASSCDRFSTARRLPYYFNKLLALDASIALVMSYFSPSFVAYTLMASERTKRTLLILRMLPVESDVIIVGKESAGALAVLGLTVCNVASFLGVCQFLSGSFLADVKVIWVIDALFFLVVFLQLFLWMFLTFQQKWATQIPFLAANLIYPAILIVRHTHFLSHAFVSMASYFIPPFAVLTAVTFHALMRREFDRQDWAMPTSE